MSIEEHEQRNEQLWDTAREPMDKKRKKLMNGFHTVWDAEFKENESLVGRIALNKDVAFLKFSLKEVGITIFEQGSLSSRPMHNNWTDLLDNARYDWPTCVQDSDDSRSRMIEMTRKILWRSPSLTSRFTPSKTLKNAKQSTKIKLG